MIVLDVEIKKAILGRGETPIEGIEYCAGWRDFENMGIACVCTFDTDTGLSRVFLEEDLGELANYLEGKHTAGFNTNRFDLPLLREHAVFNACVDVGGEHYDMLEEIWVAQGLNPDKFVPKTHGGWGLDAVCQATLGIAKTGHGALAPVWWQQGKRGKVIDYCLNDVWMEAQLLRYILRVGVVMNGKTSVRVKPPIGYGVGNRPSGDKAYASSRADELAERGTVDAVTPMREAQCKEFDKTAEKIDRDVTSAGLGIIR